jgi:hypothetical protein
MGLVLVAKTQDAVDTFYDDTVSGPFINASDVQQAIDVLKNMVQTVSGSTDSTFSYSRSGTVSVSGTYLLLETLPSNKVGATIYVSGPKLVDVGVSNEDINTFGVTIEEHDGVTHVNLTTINVIAARSATFSMNIPCTKGKQIACFLSSGTAKNLDVNIHIEGAKV